MAFVSTLPGRLGEARASSAAGGGTSLSTTAALIPFLKGTRVAELIPRNYSTAAVVKLALNPWLTVLKTTDALATATDYSDNAQDGDSSTLVTLSSLDTLANGDAVWIGAHLPFRGIAATIGSANATASTLSVDYWDGSDLSDITPTDGTASSGATFGQSGNVTWTVPTDWAMATLRELVSTCGGSVPLSRTPRYWVRLSVSAALDSSTTASALYALNRSTAYAEYPADYAAEQCIMVETDGFGCVEALTDAGTASLIVNCHASDDGRLSP